MKIAIISPKDHDIAHRVRGTGFYIENLKKSLQKYYPENEYFFELEKDIPKNIDLIHYPYFEPFFKTLPLIKKTKTVVTVHDLTPFVFPNHFPRGIKGELNWQLQKKILKNVDSIITDSNSSKADIVKYVGVKSEKVTVIYLAASENFKPIKNTSILQSIRVKYNLPEEFALYVGDVTWNKNLPRLIRSVNKIGVPLVMVGKALVGEDFDKNNSWNQDLVEVQKLSQNNKNIIRLGFVPDEDLVSLYNGATLSVSPSLYEGFGLPILEAMACGCPVVTSREGSIPEVAGQAALFVNPYDEDSIAKGIEKILKDKKLSVSLSEKGFLQSKKFSWKKTAEETAAVYKKVLE